MKPIFKNFIIILVVIILLGVAYKYFFVKSTPASNSALSSSKTATTAKNSATTTPTATTKVDKDTQFLTTLLNISKIKVDNTIFSSPSFNSLQDNNVPVVNNETVGRTNPFAPFDVPATKVVGSTDTNALKEIISSTKN